MKSQRLGLQPINNYKRVVNPRKKRFHMSSRMNSHGKNIITKIADYEGNYVKESGLLEGDEIIAINEIPIKMITIEENTKLKILLKIGGKNEMTAKEKIEQKGQKDRQNSMEIKRKNQEKK